MCGMLPAFPAASSFRLAVPAALCRPARLPHFAAFGFPCSAARRPAAGVATPATAPSAAAPLLDSSDSSWEPRVCRRTAAKGAAACNAPGAAPAALPLVSTAVAPVGLQPLLSDDGAPELLPAASEPAVSAEALTVCKPL